MHRDSSSLRVFVVDSALSHARAWKTIALLTLLALAGSGSAQAQSVHQQAESYLAAGEFDKATRLLEESLAASPADITAHNLLGIALTASGKLEQANAHFMKAIALDPKFYPALKNLAINELRLNRVQDAKDHFQEALKLSPDDPLAHLSLGEIHFANRQFKAAVGHYLRSKDLLLKNPPALLNFARSCFESGEGARASESLERLESTDPQTNFEAGLMLAQLGRYEASARQFERARKGYPDPYQAGFNLTLAHVKARHYSSAIQSAQEVISQGYRNAELYNLLAEAYEGSGNTLEAYNALRTAARINPADEKNYLDLVVLSVDHKNYDLALEIAGIGLEHVPASQRLILQRGAVRAFKGQYAEAVEDLQQAIRLNPNENLPYFAMSMALMQMDQMHKAIEILRQRVAASPDDYLILFALGEALNRAGFSPGSAEAQDAVNALEKSVRLNPRFAGSRAALGKILFKVGDLDAAIRELDKALELDPSDFAPAYTLALALRRKGETARAEQLLAGYEKHKAEERDQFRNQTLVRILRAK